MKQNAPPERVPGRAGKQSVRASRAVNEKNTRWELEAMPELKDTPVSKVRNALTIIGLGCRFGSSDSLLLTKPEEADVVRLLTDAVEDLKTPAVRIVQIAASQDWLYALDNRGRILCLDLCAGPDGWRVMGGLPQEVPNG